MKTVIYDTKVDKYLRKYYIKRKNNDEKLLAQQFILETTEIIRYICNVLLYYDCICMQISAENIAIPFFINLFGKNGFEDLVEQGAIRFFLMTNPIMHMVTPVKGICPLSTGTFNEGPYGIPEESIKYGFNFSSTQLERKYRRLLTKKLLKCYEKPIEEIDKRIVESVYDAYKLNYFKNLNLPYEKELTDFTANESEKIGDIANYYHNLTIVAKLKYSTLDSYPIELLNNEVIKNLKKTKNIIEYTDKTFTFEKVPNFNELLDMNKILITDIPNFRKNKHSVNFRKWISAIAEKDFESYDCKEYLDCLDNNKNFWETNKGRVLKTLSVNTISTLLAPQTMGLSLIVGSGLSLLDEFYLNSLLKNWSPRFYFNETVRPLVESTTTHQS